MDHNLGILTVKQRTAWVLRESGLPIKKIAEEMGVTTNAVREHLHKAERRFREYDKYLDAKERNNEILHMELTRGEGKLIISSIIEYERILMKGVHVGKTVDEYGNLSYPSTLLPALLKRLQLLVYNEVRYNGYIQ